MTPPANRPRLRALTLGEILDTVLKICVARWRTLLRTVLIVVVPVQIVTAIINADYTVSSFEFDASRSAEETLDQLNQYVGALAVSTLLQVAAIGLATAAAFRAIVAVYLGESIGWRESLSYAFARLRALLGLTLLYVIGVVLGLILFIAPGIWLFVAGVVAMPVLLVEGLRGRRAIERSFELVRGRWWRTFGTLIVGFIVAGVISALMQGVFVIALSATDDDTLVIVLTALAGIVGMAVSTPLQAALLTVMYLDLRVRHEGFDIAQLAREIGAAEPSDDDETATIAAGDDERLWPDYESGGAPADEPMRPPPPGWKPVEGERGEDPPRLPGVPFG